jgi:hypothetical protein
MLPLREGASFAIHGALQIDLTIAKMPSNWISEWKD